MPFSLERPWLRPSLHRWLAFRRAIAMPGALCLTLLGAACGSADREGPPDALATPDSSTVVPATANVASPDTSSVDSASATAPTDSTGDPAVDSILAAIRACPRDGRWHPCSLERRLQQSGLRTEVVDTATTIPGVPLPARTWRVGQQTLRVVLFESVEAATEAADALDPARAAPRGDRSVVWPERATLLRNANLVAIFFGGSDRQVERVSNALLAGAPQPERPVTP